MTFTPTAEQNLIVRAAVETEDNLLIDALAGAAKTSTIVLIAQALPDIRMLCLAFNKKIATEMAERLPSNCTSLTLNSLGHRIWGETLGRRLILKDDKVYTLTMQYADKIKDKEEQEYFYDNMAAFMNVVRAAKAAGYIPEGYGKGDLRKKAKPVCDADEFYNGLEEDLGPWEMEAIDTILINSLDMAFNGEIDFADQLLMPTCFQSPFPRYPLILVDEAQDLSALNHRMLTKLFVKRLIAVGDPCQAIYGFRGAHETSMDLMETQFNMRRLQLSVTFRCPIEVVKHAQWRAPHMKWSDFAKEGQVRVADTWTIDDIPEDAAIICRNNAPLFNMAVQLLMAGRYAQIIGNDIGKGLVKAMSKFGKKDMLQEAVMVAIDDWAQGQKKKTKQKGHKGIDDRAECMRIFARKGKDLGDAIAYAEHLFSSTGPIKLMTGHKSKGLEFDNIFFLDANLVGDEGQERNLRYVIQTRAKTSLTYITTEGFIL